MVTGEVDPGLPQSGLADSSIANEDHGSLSAAGSDERLEGLQLLLAPDHLRGRIQCPALHGNIVVQRRGAPTNA